MKIKVNPSTKKKQSKEEWHDWFAWLPVKAQSLDGVCIVWLEKTARRRVPIRKYHYENDFSYWVYQWEYVV